MVVNVPFSCKDEFTLALDGLSLQENEAMIRIGLHGVQVLQKGHFHAESSLLKEEYEYQLAQKDNERQVYERVLLEHQTMLVDHRVLLLNEQLSKHKEEKEKYELQMNQEQEKVQHLRQQMFDIECRNVQKIDEERSLWRQEQEEKFKQYHAELGHAKGEIMQLKMSIHSMEKLKEMEIHSGVNHHMQQENMKLSTLQEELRQTKEELCQVRLTQEEKKVEALNAAMEMHKKEFEEIKETLMTTKHSSSGLGKIGEVYFHDLAEETFGTYDGFDILDKTKEAHCGDFHLTFHDFHVLVDVKNFIKGRISTTDPVFCSCICHFGTSLFHCI